MGFKPTSLMAQAAVLTLFGFAAAAEQSEISWAELAPPQTEIEDPFAALSSDQMDSLRMILRYELSEDKSRGSVTATDADRLRTQLAGQGLDVDWLFQQREDIMQQRRAQAIAINNELIGTEIRLPGFVLPLEYDGQKVTSFLLVPYAGACIHTPPPPANQMVHVSYPDGIEISGLFTPVWIEGKMNAELSVQNIGFSDGEAPVEVGYEMSAEKVYFY